MAKVRELEEYPIFGKIDLARLHELHSFVGECRERIFEDRALQEVLLNGGYEFESEDKRPKTFHAIGDPTINRTKTSMHLGHLEGVIDLVTRPRLVVIESPLIFVPGKKNDVEITTPEGFDALKVEMLQRRWAENSRVRESVREYQKLLGEAFDEYNLKCVLFGAHRARSYRAAIKDKEKDKIYQEIERVMYSEGYSALDSAYYGMGNRFFRMAGGVWEKLIADDLGKFFVLTEEEAAEGLGRIFRRN